MNCKYCGAPLDGEETLCPSCGKAVDPEETQAAPQAGAEEAPASPERAERPAEEQTPAEPTAPAQKNDKLKTVTLVVAVLALLALIAVLIVLLTKGSAGGQNGEDPSTLEATETVTESAAAETEPTEETGAAEETEPAVSYSKDADAFDEETLSQVITTVGESALTNEKLAYYYWREFYSFMNYYGTYASYLLDSASGLDTQYYEEGTTWQQMFLNSAVSTYSTCAAASEAAKAAGYTLSEAEQEGLDGLEENLESLATQNGYASAEDYLHTFFGPYCTLASYRAFMEEYTMGASYLESLLNEQEITDENLEAYYTENQATYDEAGLEKDDTLMISVRHILIQPEAVELAEGDEGYEEAIQAANDAAKAKAEALYAEWQAGDATEEAFAALANENSADTGSNTNGGLYENVAPGAMSEAFNDWCFAEGRQAGDTGIVETEHGYHIMYFVGQGTESYWHSVVYSDYQQQIYNDLCQQVIAQYPAETDLTHAALYPCNIDLAAS